MPWMSSIVENRKHAIWLVETGLPVSEAARLTGVSRQCLHKWIGRSEAEGADGLRDRSRAPHEHPNAVSPSMRRRVIRMKKRFSDEGPRKLRKYLMEEYPKERIPAASTIGLILKAEGLVTPRRRSRRTEETVDEKLIESSEPNQVWAIDYKGEFLVGRTHCYPLTITDTFSRYALLIEAHQGASAKPACRALWRTFGEFGIPSVIRCDNGTPFVSTKSPAGLTRLAVMLTRLGIKRERIEPGKPAQNGRHERFHRSLKAATANPPSTSWRGQAIRFGLYRKHYNDQRPHESLGMRTPAELYASSQRSRPRTLPPIEHPLAQAVLKVYSSGEITIRGAKLFLSASLANETVAANEVADDLVALTYGPIYLGVYSFRGREPVFTMAP